MLYEYGHGLPMDDAQARVWIKKAAALGFVPAHMWLTDHPCHGFPIGRFARLGR
jgi:TPR repeat protein